MQVDSILTLTLTIQQYAKTMPKPDTFNERLFELDAVSDCKKSITQLLSTN